MDPRRLSSTSSQLLLRSALLHFNPAEAISLYAAHQHVRNPSSIFPLAFPFLTISPLLILLQSTESPQLRYVTCCDFLGLAAHLLVVVETSQRPLGLTELLLGLGDDGPEGLEALLVVGLVARARHVLVRAVVLDLLAAVLDFCQAERCAAAFEEVA